RTRTVALTSLTAFGSRAAEPRSAEGSHRWLRDAAPSALVRAQLHCPARCRLASLASDPSGTRGFPSSEDHRRVVEIAREGDRRQPLERLDVLGARLEDDLVRQLGAGIGLRPADQLAVVADVLLVEAVLRPAGLVRLAGPETGGVRCQRLVAEDDVAVRVEPELELR